MQKLIFLLCFVGQSLLGQVKVGNYSIDNDSLIGGIELTINENQTFSYVNRNHASCFVWYTINGKWKINNDILILNDSVKVFHKDFNKTVTQNRITLYTIVGKNLILKSQRGKEVNPEFYYSRELWGNFTFKE